MPAKFQLKRGTTGKFRFSLLSTNGQIVASSEVYERKAAALAGIRSVQKLAGTAQVEDTTTKEWAEAEAAKKATKKAATKKAAIKKAATKKAAVKAAAPKKAAPKKAAAVKAATPKKAAAAGRRPVRQRPQPFSIPPEDLNPRI